MGVCWQGSCCISCVLLSVLHTTRAHSPFLCQIFFTASDHRMLQQLHMVERLFVLVAHRLPPALPRYIPHALAHLTQIICELPWWRAAYTCWQRVRSTVTDNEREGKENGICEKPRFRISCKCTLRALSNATTDEISQSLSGALAAATGWHPSPRDHQLEVSE